MILSQPNMKKHTYHRLLFLGAAIFSMAVAEVSFFPGILPVFSSHMAGHIILLLIAAPLAVLAMAEKPEAVGGLAFSISRRLATIPWTNWIVGVGILWIWYIPAIFNNLIAVENRTVHGHIHFLSFVHSGSLLLSGVLFCWPLAGPFRSHRLKPSESMLYLTSAFVACSLLAFLIGFARPGLYGGSVALARGDQQLAALVMWVPCSLMYLGSVIYLLRESMGDGLWKSSDFYRQARRRRIKVSDQQPAQNDGYLDRGGVVIPQMGIPDPLEAV
jgi:hypothetical protein